jgi:hypothetical protein
VSGLIAVKFVDGYDVARQRMPDPHQSRQHMSLNLIWRKASGKKDSLRLLRKVATWGDD